jgi:hypothetical protein
MIGFILGPLILSFLLALLRIYQKTILLQPVSVLPPPAPAPPEKAPEPGPGKALKSKDPDFSAE